jgi:hypothetical protein
MRSTCAPGAWAVSAASHADIDAQTDQQAWMVALLGSLYDAVARASRDWLLGFATTRAPSGLGAPLATLPRVQEAIGEIEGWLHANRVLLDEHIARTDAGDAPTVTTSGLVKRTVTEQAIRVVEHALKLSGNHGLSRHNPLERHYRDVLCGRVHTPQDDAIAMAAGRAALEAAAAAAAAAARAARQATARVRAARRTLRGHSIEAMRKDGGGAHRAGRLAPCGRRWPGSRGHICALGEGAADFRETSHAMRDHWLRDSEARCGAARVRRSATHDHHKASISLIFTFVLHAPPGAS